MTIKLTKPPIVAHVERAIPSFIRFAVLSVVLVCPGLESVVGPDAIGHPQLGQVGARVDTDWPQSGQLTSGIIVAL